MSRFLRSGIAVFGLLLSLLGTPAAANAAPGGSNSDAAKACQRGGYANYVRGDGTVFLNTGDCVSYAARGGPLLHKLVLTIERTNSSTIVATAMGYNIGDTICFQGIGTRGFPLGGEVCFVTTAPTVSATSDFSCLAAVTLFPRQTATRVRNITNGLDVTEFNPGC